MAAGGATGHPSPGGMSGRIRTPAGLSPSQARIAKDIIAVGKRMGANPLVIQSALATSLVESTLSNPNQAQSDRDSAGPFQQRPSQGWGSVAQVRDTRYAAAQYYKRAIPAFKGGQRNLGALAQSVQRSAFPGRYAQELGKARNIYIGLRGGSAGGSAGAARIDPNMTKKQRQAASRRAKKQNAGSKVGTGDSRSSIAQQAELSSELRYGRERSGIASLLADAQASLKTNTALEEGVARGVSESTKAAVPKVAQAFDQAAGANVATKAEVDAALSRLGPGADPYKAATARESGGAARRLAELAASAQSELVRRGVQAQEQRSFGLRRAQGQYESDRAKLGQRLQDIAQEEGTYVAATYGQGLEKAKDRKVKTGIAKENSRQRTLDRQARLLQTKLQQQGMNSRDAAKQANQWKLEQFKESGRQSRAAGGGGLSEPARRQRRETADKVQTQVENARAQINRLRGTKGPTALNSTEIRQLLVSGSSKLGIPKFDNWAVNAAYDLVLKGGLGPANLATIKRKAYGRVPKGWKPRRVGKVSGGVNAGVGAVSGKVGTR